MSKELTPLEHLEFLRQYEINEEHHCLNDRYVCKQSFDIIETTLKNYNELQNKYDELETEYLDQQRSMLKYDEVKEKKFKALEIIKEKEVVIPILLRSNILDEYNNNPMFVSKKLSQEEYDLLKEVLLWD